MFSCQHGKSAIGSDEYRRMQAAFLTMAQQSGLPNAQPAGSRWRQLVPVSQRTYPLGPARGSGKTRGRADHSHETLVAMLRAESERTRVAAAEALLSRGWGAPTAHVETGPPGSFAEALDAVKLRAQSDN